MDDRREHPTRRDILKQAGLGTVALGAAMVTAGGAHAETAPGANETPAGYRETPHVRQFYASARF